MPEKSSLDSFAIFSLGELPNWKSAEPFVMRGVSIDTVRSGEVMNSPIPLFTGRQAAKALDVRPPEKPFGGLRTTRKLTITGVPVVTVIGKAFWTSRKRLPDYTVSEIHPVMKMETL